MTPAAANRLNHLTVSIASLGRAEIRRKLRNFKGRFKLDFTEEYLNKLSLERLRHILLAAMLTNISKAS